MGEKPVLAKKAKWTFTSKEGEVQSFIGSFPLAERGAMKGTLKYLMNSNLLPPDYTAEVCSDAYVIRMTIKNCPQLGKFQDWVIKHDLIPDLLKKLGKMPTHEPPMAKPPQERSAPAYPPLHGDHAKPLVSQLPWLLVDTGYPGTNSYLVAATTNPEIASQAGYYLHKKGYITDEYYNRLNAEIKHDLETQDTSTEYRIAIPEDHFKRFAKKFPTAGRTDLDKKDSKIWENALSEEPKSTRGPNPAA